MASWWKKVFGGGDEKGRPPEPAAPQQPRARWLPANDSGNPFGVPLLDLMMLQGYLATSKDPQAAARSVSWRESTGAELAPTAVAQRPPIDCELRYPCARSLPDGILYAPPSMDEKWVLALRDGHVMAARSWTGAVEALADARREGEMLVLERLRTVENTGLQMFGPVVETFDWLVRSHALGQRIPLPVSDQGGAMLEQAPLSGFSSFGKVLFCAAKGWRPPPIKRPLRSDGDVILSARKGDVAALERAVKSGADVDSPATFAGYTALHLSIVRKDVALFDALLELGASPAAVADHQTHALGIAVVHKAPMPIFEALAKSALDLTAPNEDGFTALHAAAEVNFPEIVPWLVQHGLSMDARTKRGHTPLHIACGLGHLEVAESLLAAGADANAASPGGTPLEVAKAENKPALVELLAQSTHRPH
jgi:hypothetical protein